MPTVLYEKRGPIAYITLNRPDKRNAIDTETDDLLFDAWTRFREDDEVRLAILTGAGDQAFCAGADLASHVDGWLDGGPGLGRSLLGRGFAGGITRGLHRTNKPIIAALNGWVIGGGIELALACDIRVAADDIQFGFFHMRRGMHFGDGGIVRLVNTCGVGIAMELELMGEPITAERARECHLVNRVVPRDQLMPTAEDIAAKILRNPRAAVESAKETILEVIGRPLDDQLRLECLYSYSVMDDPEIVARKDEFLQRRDADRPTRGEGATGEATPGVRNGRR
jgi:enoyl-CoA hydratase/carnithine racemase